jgi:hypothetical protein
MLAQRLPQIFANFPVPLVVPMIPPINPQPRPNPFQFPQIEFGLQDLRTLALIGAAGSVAYAITGIAASFDQAISNNEMGFEG